VIQSRSKSLSYSQYGIVLNSNRSRNDLETSVSFGLGSIPSSGEFAKRADQGVALLPVGLIAASAFLPLNQAIAPAERGLTLPPTKMR
jgi:hypothetical protein